MKLANKTLYWIGTNIKLTKVAAGHTFQFVIKVSLIFYLENFHPFSTPFKEQFSLTQLLKIKKPVKNGGANRSWSKSIPNVAAFNLWALLVGSTGAFNSPETILGMSLEYQTCKMGPKNTAPVMVKLMFLRTSKSLFF